MSTLPAIGGQAQSPGVELVALVGPAALTQHTACRTAKQWRRGTNSVHIKHSRAARNNANNLIFIFTACSCTPCSQQDQTAVTTPRQMADNDRD